MVAIADRLASRPGPKVILFGTLPTARVRAEDVELGLDHTRFTLKDDVAQIGVNTRLLGRTAIAGALAAAAVGRAVG